MGKASRERRRRAELRSEHHSPTAPGGERRGAPTGAAPRGAPPTGPSRPGPSTPSHAHAVQMLAAALDEAVQALAHHDHRSAESIAAALAHPQAWGLDAEAHRRAVENLLRARLLTSVKGCWRRGWQPADLLRYARRVLSTAHQRLLAATVAAEVARYAPDTVDPAWARHLEDHDARVWWTPDQTFLSALELVWPGRWPELVPAVVEVVSFTEHLGPLPVIGPVPGQGRVAPTAVRSDVDERLLARVRALLAKAESTNYPAEAETFTAGAQSLMARHSIDAALLAATAPSTPGGPGSKPGVTSVRIGIDNPYESAKASLLNAIASANRCKAVWMKHYGFLTVVGFRTDLDAVEVLFTSLLVQATASVNGVGAHAGSGAHSRSRSFRQSFLLAFAARIGERLEEAMTTETERAVEASSGGNLLPVLASRAEAVHEAVSEMFPDMVRGRGSSARDAAGWAHGRAAADVASLAAGASLPAG